MREEACVVCGTDLSENARPALEASAALAALAGAELWIVHAADAGGAAPPAGAAVRELEGRLAAWRGDVGARLGVARVRDAVVAGPPAEALSAFAAGRGAAAVVVSSRGHSAGPLFRLGGTSERVAVECPVPVLVVRDAAPFSRWARGEAPLRVALAVDFTPASDPAIRFVRRLRAAGPLSLAVVHVYYPGASSRYGLEPLEVSADRDGSLEALLARDLARRVGDLAADAAVTYRPYLGAGRIGDHVLEVAREERADVVVVGTRGKRGYRRLASVSSVVLHHGESSVACAPRGAAAELDEPLPSLARVLVATDLSELSCRAVPYAYGLLAGGGEVWLLHVAPAAAGAAGPDEDADLARRLRALVPATSASRGVVTRTEVVRGEDVAGAICQAAARHGADAICVASHGRSGLSRAVLGSVAEAVVRRGDRPVLVVPSPRA